jgi:hypothetical protein
MGRRVFRIAAALLALLVIADTAFWYVATGRLQAGFLAWAEHERGAGQTIETGPIRVSGWPLAAAITVDGVAIRTGLKLLPEGLTWRTDRLTLRLPLWYPRQLDVIASGEQQVQLGGLPGARGTGDDLRATIPLRDSDGRRGFDLTIRNLKLSAGPEEDLSIGLLQAHADTFDQPENGDPPVRLSVTAEALDLPHAIRWPLGSVIASCSAELALHGAVPPEGDPTARAIAWRDGGGSLEIQHLAIGWGPLGVSASATLALDDQLQPMGAGNGHFVGYAAALDALASNGMMSRSAATASKAVLSLLAGTSADEEKPEVDVPLTLQYRTLSMRQVPLVRFPELDWPAP